MSYTVTITTALGRTLSRSVDTLDEVRHTINATHMARFVQVLDNSNGEYFPEWAIRTLVEQDTLV
jgi:hypothetical protein